MGTLQPGFDPWNPTGYPHYVVGRCSVQVDPAWFQRLNLKCDKLLSNFGFNCNLRHYYVVHMDGDAEDITDRALHHSPLFSST